MIPHPDSGTLPELTDWNPISLAEAGALFGNYPNFWCIAGGWAIDLFIGGQPRHHADVDILVDQADLQRLHRAMPGWLLYAASDGRLEPWLTDTSLREGIHDVWCRRPGKSWELQFMAAPFSSTEWIYRRDVRVRGPRQGMCLTLSGLPALAPEIQLLYKSRLPNRPKDEQDFSNVLPLLGDARCRWLISTLKFLYGDHPWIDPLQQMPQ